MGNPRQHRRKQHHKLQQVLKDHPTLSTIARHLYYNSYILTINKTRKNTITIRLKNHQICHLTLIDTTITVIFNKSAHNINLHDPTAIEQLDNHLKTIETTTKDKSPHAKK